MSDQLHDKILSCDDLAIKSLSQLKKMNEFYQIKIKNLKKQNLIFKYQQWLSDHRKLHSLFLILSITIFVVSFYLTLTVTKSAVILSVISILYLFVTSVFINDIRNQAIIKNIATINYMIQTFKEEDYGRITRTVFKRKAQIVYECIRNAPNGRINNSDLLKATRRYDPKLDKNTINKILDNDLIDVVIKENGPYSTNSRDLSNTDIYKIKIL